MLANRIVHRRQRREGLQQFASRPAPGFFVVEIELVDSLHEVPELEGVAWSGIDVTPGADG